MTRVTTEVEVQTGLELEEFEGKIAVVEEMGTGRVACGLLND